MHKKATERQIADNPESVHLQERIFKAVNDFSKFVDARGFFKDHEKRQLLGIALVITCDTIGDMEMTIKDQNIGGQRTRTRFRSRGRVSCMPEVIGAVVGATERSGGHPPRRASRSEPAESENPVWFN
jgi:hypothetical protein